MEDAATTSNSDVATNGSVILPHIFRHLPVPPSLVSQGAEALLYRSSYLLPTLPCAVKYRPSKPYRHPILDLRLTKHRILAEARILMKCRRDGVPVPGVYALDEAAGLLMIEWVEGKLVRTSINEWLREKKEQGEEGPDSMLGSLMSRIGGAVGRLHAAGVVHGDLTTSNMMLQQPKAVLNDEDGTSQHMLAGEIVLIDFGLSSQSSQDEDRAVDLYVLERAFGSTHPRAEAMFTEVLDAYGSGFKGGSSVLRKLEEVRLRGRKRSMIG